MAISNKSFIRNKSDSMKQNKRNYKFIKIIKF